MGSFSLVEVFPHIILAAELPATGEVVDFLIFVSIFECLLVVDARSIEENVPIGADFDFLEAVELEGVDDAPIFGADYFVFSNYFL